MAALVRTAKATLDDTIVLEVDYKMKLWVAHHLLSVIKMGVIDPKVTQSIAMKKLVDQEVEARLKTNMFPCDPHRRCEVQKINPK